MSGTKLTQSDLREVVCYKCKKTGHIKKLCPLNNNKNNGGGKGAGEDSKRSNGKLEKKKKWHNTNPDNKLTMEKNGKTYYWCKICNYGRGSWVNHKEEVCLYRRKQNSDESSPDSDNAGLVVMDLAESGPWL